MTEFPQFAVCCPREDQTSCEVKPSAVGLRRVVGLDQLERSPGHLAVSISGAASKVCFAC